MPEWPSNSEDTTYLSAILSNTLSLYYKFPFTKIITWLICTSMTTYAGSNPEKMWEASPFKKIHQATEHFQNFRLLLTIPTLLFLQFLYLETLKRKHVNWFPINKSKIKKTSCICSYASPEVFYTFRVDSRQIFLNLSWTQHQLEAMSPLLSIKL